MEKKIIAIYKGREAYWDKENEVWRYCDTEEILENWR